MDVLHKFSDAVEWTGIWNTGLENSVYCNISTSIPFDLLLVVSEFQSPSFSYPCILKDNASLTSCTYVLRISRWSGDSGAVMSIQEC